MLKSAFIKKVADLKITWILLTEHETQTPYRLYHKNISSVS